MDDANIFQLRLNEKKNICWCVRTDVKQKEIKNGT